MVGNQTHIPLTSNCDNCYKLQNGGIEIYGGFDGIESLITDRSSTYPPTILSGDIGEIQGGITDNCYQ